MKMMERRLKRGNEEYEKSRGSTFKNKYKTKNQSHVAFALWNWFEMNINRIFGAKIYWNGIFISLLIALYLFDVPSLTAQTIFPNLSTVKM